MTNPSDAVGTNGAYGGRTSVDAFNDVLGVFQSAGILSGWYVRASSGMTVLVGGQSGVRDVAIAEDQLGDRTTVNNRLGSPISVTIATASPSTARVDSIVLYVNKPATVSTMTIDNPEACGIIAVSGTTTAPSSADIRSAITADGGSGATAYYVVIADITIPASATVITQTNITAYTEGLVGRKAMAAGAIATQNLANGAVTGSKVDWTTMVAVGQQIASSVNIGSTSTNVQTMKLNKGVWLVSYGYRLACSGQTANSNQRYEIGISVGGVQSFSVPVNGSVSGDGTMRSLISSQTVLTITSDNTTVASTGMWPGTGEAVVYQGTGEHLTAIRIG